MKIIPEDKWAVVQRDKKPLLKVECPGCGLKGDLDHTVDEKGHVQPSLDCPECPYHEFVQLEGWDRGAQSFEQEA